MRDAFWWDFVKWSFVDEKLNCVIFRPTTYNMILVIIHRYKIFLKVDAAYPTYQNQISRWIQYRYHHINQYLLWINLKKKHILQPKNAMALERNSSYQIAINHIYSITQFTRKHNIRANFILCVCSII
jgi:hypothetical protein